MGDSRRAIEICEQLLDKLIAPERPLSRISKMHPDSEACMTRDRVYAGAPEKQPRLTCFSTTALSIGR